MKIHHLGIVVKNIEESIRIFRILGYELLSPIIEDSVQNNRIAFLRQKESEELMELIEALNCSSSVLNFEYGLHHLCFEVDKTELYEKFKEARIGKIFTKPIIAPAINDRTVVFAYLRNGLFVEFLFKEEEYES